MPRFAANLSMLWSELPFLERFPAAARAGFEAVEFLFPYAVEKARLADVLAESRLQLVLFNMPPGDWEAGERGMACDPRRAGEFRDGVAKAVEYALALGCKRVHCMAGLPPPGAGEAESREAYLSSLRYAGAELEKRGIELLVEALNTRDVPGYYLTTSRQAFEIISEAKVPNLRFQYDVYHMQIMEGDVAATIERHLPAVGHIQIADVPGRHEPGTGQIDFPFLFRNLDRIGYRGWVGCEYRPLAGTEAGLGWIRPYLAARERP